MSTGMQNAISRTSQSFAQYYDANVRGNVYTFGISNTALVSTNAVATGVTATSRPVIGLWNDVGTGKNLVVLNATVVATKIENSAVAVNDTLVSTREYELKDGDKVVLLPPVCGG